MNVRTHFRIRSFARPVALLAACAVVLTGCGGSDDGGSDSNSSSSSSGSSSSTSSSSDAKAAFASSCGGCHALAAAGTKGSAGPDLDTLTLDEKTVRDQIEHGGGAMPGGLLEGADADAVAKYVAENAGK